MTLLFSGFHRSDEGTVENAEDETPRTSRPSSRRRKHRKHKVKNGKYPVDMTPPDKLLKKAERKAKRYTREKKVPDIFSIIV